MKTTKERTEAVQKRLEELEARRLPSTASELQAMYDELAATGAKWERGSRQLEADLRDKVKDALFDREDDRKVFVKFKGRVAAALREAQAGEANQADEQHAKDSADEAAKVAAEGANGDEPAPELKTAAGEPVGTATGDGDSEDEKGEGEEPVVAAGEDSKAARRRRKNGGAAS